MSGFRKGYNCESVLIRLVENCKQALDSNMVYGIVLTDLSKAFDCLPPRLVVAKLQAYGLSHAACALIANYFTERQQCVKTNGKRSAWKGLLKGAPQGSILGPFIFNVFLNDLLHQMGCLENCDLYNYADDNTAGVCGKTPEEVCSRLEIVVASLLHWFDLNFMQANPSKFQFMMFGKKTDDYSIKLAHDVTLVSCPAVQLLGITIDCTLTFTDHIYNLCKKVSKRAEASIKRS